MKTYLYFQTVIQARVGINPDGTLDSPEILKKFTTEFKGNHKKKEDEVKDFVTKISDSVEL